MIQKILFVGEGGQGVQFAAQLLTNAAFASGKKVLYIPNFGVEQRGGVSVAFIQISDDQEIFYPKFDKADVALLFCGDRCQLRAKEFLSPTTKIITFDILGSNSNLLLLGKFIKETQILPKEKIEEEIRKNPRKTEENLNSFQKGYGQTI